MRRAITLRACGHGGDIVRQLWDEFALFERAPSMPTLGYGPHITLAIYDDVSDGELIKAMSETFRGRQPLKLTFSHLDVFEMPEFIVWASPKASADLQQMHAGFHSTVPSARCDGDYRPGRWAPHCTLASNVAADLRQDARNAVAAGIEPFHVVFDVAEVVSFPPPTVIASVALR